MTTASSLRSRLLSLDSKPYGALKSLVGSYNFAGFTLHIDKVQSDPYAPPSRIRLTVPLTETALPAHLYSTRDQQVALRDFIARDIADAISQGPGEFNFVAPGQEILERSSVVFVGEAIEVRCTFGFPAAGRRVKGRASAALLVDALPDLVRYSVLGDELDIQALNQHVETYTDYLWLRRQLPACGLVAFIADGSRLARASGDTDFPAKHNVAFRSPETLSTSFITPSGKSLRGLGLAQGISLIVGGGYHGKSTLLKALERGVYAHVPGDGREYVVTAQDAVSVRAEDGRAVTGVDISPFISGLPGDISTQQFSTTNASGSTSQAANISEALELGTSLLLIDEDTSATNFMIRDDAMRALIDASHEPITPFVDRARALWDELRVSTVLVVGGTGAFFGEAHTVLALTDYVASDVTQKAHEIAGCAPSDGAERQGGASFFAGFKDEKSSVRVAKVGALGAVKARKSPRARGLHTVQVDRDDIDVRYLSQLVDSSQTQAIALALPIVEKELASGRALVEAVREVSRTVEEEGIDVLRGSLARGDLAAPRAVELFAAINRYRKLTL